MMQGIAEVFDEREASLLILPARLDRSRDAGKAREAGVDGFLVFCLAEDDPRIRSMIARGLPVAVIHGPRLPEAAYVGIDDFEGGRLIGEHVLDHDHQRLAILTYPILEDDLSGFVTADRLNSSTIGSAANRILGIQERVAVGGMSLDSIPIWESPINTVESGIVGAGRLLDRADRPTAILAMSDQLAMGAIQAAKVRGLRVPHDLTVVGFDDIPASALFDPPLTTVRQSLRDAGARAARMLIDGWDGEPPREMLPIELIVRASSGPAPDR
jgi:DNA-binding LacI/PurR family transcriptional regulator